MSATLFIAHDAAVTVDVHLVGRDLPAEPGDVAERECPVAEEPVRMDEGVRDARRLDGFLYGLLGVEQGAGAGARGRRIQTEVGRDEPLHLGVLDGTHERGLIRDLHAAHGGDHELHAAAGAAEARFVGEVSLVNGRGRFLERLHPGGIATRRGPDERVDLRALLAARRHQFPAELTRGPHDQDSRHGGQKVRSSADGP